MSLITLDTQFLPPTLLAEAKALQPEAERVLKSIRERACVGKEWTGWFDWPQSHGFALARDIRKVCESIAVSFDTVVVIGIGGSYLGTRAVADALTSELPGVGRGRDQKPIVYAGHHLNARGMEELMAWLDQRQPIINVISKSGTTTEPAIAFRLLRAYMEKRFGRPQAAQRMIVTTDAHKGSLRALAKAEGYTSFSVPDDVGGRFSVLTAVGLVPLALAGFNIEELLKGADSVFSSLQSDSTLKNHPALSYATVRQAAWRQGMRIELLSYTDPRQRHLIEWWRQLFGESEGKQGKGMFPDGFLMTTDLHSLGQYAQEGVRHLFETFLIFEDQTHLTVPVTGDNGDDLQYLESRPIETINRLVAKASKVAHADGGVPCLELKAPAMSERTLGALFAFFETSCAVSALMLGVNPFDQPGVETYKRNLFGLLGKPGFEHIGKDLTRRL